MGQLVMVSVQASMLSIEEPAIQNMASKNCGTLAPNNKPSTNASQRLLIEKKPQRTLIKLGKTLKSLPVNKLLSESHMKVMKMFFAIQLAGRGMPQSLRRWNLRTTCHYFLYIYTGRTSHAAINDEGSDKKKQFSLANITNHLKSSSGSHTT